jgi:ribulose-phosphate 3-epimerase
LKKIHALGCRAGVTLNPATPAATLEPSLPLADLVLVMTVQPGYSGQQFQPEMIGKVAAVRARLDALGSAARVEVDGGVSADTLPRLRQAGADTFVAASAIFRHPGGIAAGIQALRSLLVEPGKS